MSTLEIKRELHELIDKGDEAMVQGFYSLLKNYLNNKEEYELLAESEEDIKEGRIYSINEVKNIVAGWRK
jgi:ADP-dependent phosphofructokinase/glucokinase